MAGLRVDGISIAVDCNFCLKLEQVLNTKSDKLNSEFSIPFTLKETDDIKWLYKKYGREVRIPAVLTEYNNYEYDFIFKSVQGRKYRAVLTKNENDWLVCLDKTRICDLDLGTTEHTEANILDFINNGTGEFDGTFSTAPILGNYGNQGEEWLMKHIRYAFSPFDILKKGFKKCGIEFDSPVMEADPHLWSYLLKKNWWENSGQGLLIYGEAESNADFASAGDPTFPVPAQIIVSDAGGNITPQLGVVQGIEYTNPQPENVDYCICLTGTLVNNGATDAVWSYDLFLSPQYTFTIPPNSSLDVDICLNVNISTNAIPIFTRQAGEITILAGFNQKIIGKAKNFYKGDILQNAEMLDCNLTVLDVLKMSKHLYNGFIDYDSIERKFFMSPPYTTEDVETFYKSPLNNVKLNDIVCDSRGIGTFRDTANERVYCFKDSNDEYISSEIEEGNRTDQEGEYGVLSFVTELEVDNTKIKENCNPLAEPTLNKFGGQFQGGGALIQLQDSIYIPQFIDNTNGNQSNCINPRVFYLYNGGQVVNGIEQEIYFEGNILTRYPNIYQELPDSVNILGNPNFDRRQLTYEEIYNKYYRQFEQRFILGEEESYQILIDYKDYRAASFRTRYKIFYQGITRHYLLTRKRFNGCGKPVKWEFVRENLNC